jgi:hypothetical protein
VRKSQFTARFVDLLGDAAPQVVQPAVELANLLLVVDSLQRRGGNRTIESTCAV